MQNTTSLSNHFIFSFRSHITNWILDKRATNYIFCSLDLFTTYTSIPPIQIHLPNGAQTCATIISLVYISKNLVLHNVLYMSLFTFNLILITKLTSTLNYHLMFIDKSSIMQDITTSRMIRFVMVVHGLYVLEGLGTHLLPVATTNKVSTCDLDVWHCRLGHLSNSKIFILNKMDPYVSPFSHKTPCMICPIAKWKRLSFPNNSTQTSHVFQLAPLDIWGLLSVTSIHGHRYLLTLVNDYPRHT